MSWSVCLSVCLSVYYLYVFLSTLRLSSPKGYFSSISKSHLDNAKKSVEGIVSTTYFLIWYLYNQSLTSLPHSLLVRPSGHTCRKPALLLLFQLFQFSVKEFRICLSVALLLIIFKLHKHSQLSSRVSLHIFMEFLYVHHVCMYMINLCTTRKINYSIYSKFKNVKSHSNAM